MGLTTLCFGVVVLAATLLNRAAWKRKWSRTPAPYHMTLLLAATFVIGNLLVWTLGRDIAPDWFPPFDLAAGLTALLAWKRSRNRVWLLALSLTFVADGLAHLAYQWSEGDYRIYAIQLNAIFVLQVLIAGWDGIRYGAEIACDRVFGPSPRMRAFRNI